MATHGQSNIFAITPRLSTLPNARSIFPIRRSYMAQIPRMPKFDSDHLIPSRITFLPFSFSPNINCCRSLLARLCRRLRVSKRALSFPTTSRRTASRPREASARSDRGSAHPSGSTAAFARPHRGGSERHRDRAEHGPPPWTALFPQRNSADEPHDTFGQNWGDGDSVNSCRGIAPDTLPTRQDHPAEWYTETIAGRIPHPKVPSRGETPQEPIAVPRRAGNRSRSWARWRLRCP